MIKELCNKKNISLSELARQIGQTPQNFGKKLKTIADIKNAGLDVEKIIINSNLTEEEAFAAEASLINAFNYVSDAGLTNIVAGNHSAEALLVDEYERINGAIELEEKDIRHRIRLHICIHWRKIKFIFNEINKSEFIGGESA